MKTRTGIIPIKQNLFSCIFAALFLSGLCSCCTRKDCSGFEDLNEIELVNFTAADVDSIAFEIFDGGSNFTNKIDSTFTSAHSRGDGNNGFIISMPEHLTSNHNYKITLYSTGEIYKLSAFSSRKEECNCPGDKYNVLDNYYVNGTRNNSTYLAITR